MAKKKYKLVIEFETETPVKPIVKASENTLVQFENAIPYFVETKNKNLSVNESFVYGSGSFKLTEVKSKK